MNTKKFLLSLIVSMLLPLSAYAQLSVDSLGIDTSQNESYQCVRYADASQNTISVTNESNQETFLSIKNARKRVQKSIRRANNRTKRLNKRHNKLKRQLKNIQTKIIPRPNSVKNIKRLRKAIKKTKRALATVRGQRKNLVNLRKQVSSCKDDAPLVGGLVVKTITYPSIFFNGAYTSYHIGIYYNVTRPVEKGDAYCLGSPQFYQGVRLATVLIDPCPVTKADYSCIAQHSGVRGFGLSGVSGTDYQYACAAGDEPWRCDFGEANLKAAELAAQYSDVVVLGKANGSSCDRFVK